MFAAVGAGWGIWKVALRAKSKAWIAAPVLGVVAAALSSVYPIEPSYERYAMLKALYVVLNAPRDGLFCAASPDADVADGPWDLEEFSELLDKVPDGVPLTQARRPGLT